jgi:hypothetical protein
MRIYHANAVGAQEPDAMRPSRFETSLFERRAFFPYFAEAGGHHDRSRDPAPATVFQGLRRRLRRDDQERQVYGVWYLAEIRIDRLSEQLPRSLADKVDRAAVSALEKVATYAIT